MHARTCSRRTTYSSWFTEATPACSTHATAIAAWQPARTTFTKSGSKIRKALGTWSNPSRDPPWARKNAPFPGSRPRARRPVGNVRRVAGSVSDPRGAVLFGAGRRGQPVRGRLCRALAGHAQRADRLRQDTLRAAHGLALAQAVDHGRLQRGDERLGFSGALLAGRRQNA